MSILPFSTGPVHVQKERFKQLLGVLGWIKQLPSVLELWQVLLFQHQADPPLVGQHFSPQLQTLQQLQGGPPQVRLAPALPRLAVAGDDDATSAVGAVGEPWGHQDGQPLAQHEPCGALGKAVEIDVLR